MPKKTYPDNTLLRALNERGLNARVQWEIPGPKDTQVAWMTGIWVNNSIVIVQTFEGVGWEAYTPPKVNDVDQTIADVIERVSS